MIVNVTVPVGVVVEAPTVKVEVPEPVTDVGLNCESVLAGSPLALNVTTPVNPFKAVTVTVYEPRMPRVTVRLAGDALIEKSGPAEELTTRVTLVLWTVVPLVPVTVTM